MTGTDSTSQPMPLSQLEMEDIREAFRLFDTEGNGSISAQELHAVLLQVEKNEGVPVTGVLKALETLPECTLLSLDDFMALVTNRGGPDDDRDELRRIFDSFDKEGKGYIDLSDLRSVAAILGEMMSDDELQEMITRASNEGDDKVTFDDFTSIMNKRLFS